MQQSFGLAQVVLSISTPAVLVFIATQYNIRESQDSDVSEKLKDLEGEISKINLALKMRN